MRIRAILGLIGARRMRGTVAVLAAGGGVEVELVRAARCGRKGAQSSMKL
jgi:hypothetical protein